MATTGGCYAARSCAENTADGGRCVTWTHTYCVARDSTLLRTKIDGENAKRKKYVCNRYYTFIHLLIIRCWVRYSGISSRRRRRCQRLRLSLSCLPRAIVARAPVRVIETEIDGIASAIKCGGRLSNLNFRASQDHV